MIISFTKLSFTKLSVRLVECLTINAKLPNKMFKIKTDRGNYFCCLVDHHQKEWWYDIQTATKVLIDKEKRFVRHLSNGEFFWLYSVLTGANPDQDCWITKHESMDFDEENIYIPQAGYFVEEKCIEYSEDYSDYDSSLCNNGGKYGYWINQHLGKLHYFDWYGKEVIVPAYYFSHHTTSDFEYCPSCGSFGGHGYNNSWFTRPDNYETEYLDNVEFGCGYEIHIF